MSWLEVTLRLEGGDKLVSKVDLLVFMLNLLTRLESREVVLAAMLTTGDWMNLVVLAKHADFDPPVRTRKWKWMKNAVGVNRLCPICHWWNMTSFLMIYYSGVVLYFYSKSNKGEGCGGDGGCYWCLLFSWDSPNLSQMRPRHVRLRKYKCSAKNKTLSFGVRSSPFVESGCRFAKGHPNTKSANNNGSILTSFCWTKYLRTMYFSTNINNIPTEMYTFITFSTQRNVVRCYIITSYPEFTKSCEVIRCLSRNSDCRNAYCQKQIFKLCL